MTQNEPQPDDPDRDEERTVHQGGELAMTGSGVRKLPPSEPASTNHGGDLELTGEGMRPVDEHEE